MGEGPLSLLWLPTGCSGCLRIEQVRARQPGEVSKTWCSTGLKRPRLRGRGLREPGLMGCGLGEPGLRTWPGAARAEGVWPRSSGG